MSETRYTSDHEWVRLEDDGTLTIGLTDYAQDLLGEIAFVELPEVAREVVEGETCATVEGARGTSEFFAPVAGRVAEINDNIVEDPGLINRDPSGEGWFMRLEPSEDEVFDTLLDEEAYEAFLETL
jgi:glycine cleavage system H protein